MIGWVWVFFFLENITSSAGFVGSVLKSIFQLKAHVEINKRSLLSILALSFISLTIVKKDVSSANNFTLDFNLFGKSLM